MAIDVSIPRCRHCVFAKDEKMRADLRVCCWGGLNELVEASRRSCERYVPNRKRKSYDKHRLVADTASSAVTGEKVTVMSRGNDQFVSTMTAKQRLEVLERLWLRPKEQREREEMSRVQYGMRTKMHDNLMEEMSRTLPEDERTECFSHAPCNGRCCLRKDICMHYRSWIEHGKPDYYGGMINSVSGCIRKEVYTYTQNMYSEFIPMPGKTMDDLKTYSQVF